MKFPRRTFWQFCKNTYDFPREQIFFKIASLDVFVIYIMSYNSVCSPFFAFIFVDILSIIPLPPLDDRLNQVQISTRDWVERNTPTRRSATFSLHKIATPFFWISIISAGVSKTWKTLKGILNFAFLRKYALYRVTYIKL